MQAVDLGYRARSAGIASTYLAKIPNIIRLSYVSALAHQRLIRVNARGSKWSETPARGRKVPDKVPDSFPQSSQSSMSSVTTARSRARHRRAPVTARRDYDKSEFTREPQT
jgi:hypothetical protein